MSENSEKIPSTSASSSGDSEFRVEIKSVNSTTGTRISSNYFSTPARIDVGRNVRNLLPEIKNEGMKNGSLLVLASIERALREFTTQGINTEVIPPLNASIQKDGSLLLEWAEKDFRVGFSIEPNINESGWYIVSSPELGDNGASGFLFREGFEGIVRRLVAFIVANT